ncbi:nitrous oxide reductase family maturation protein NosD [Shewanella rhizosphaerae]|nr:nitrous oxide reductase family maturation protein NosD [Shewanella rhizosphaerae]
MQSLRKSLRPSFSLWRRLRQCLVLTLSLGLCLVPHLAQGADQSQIIEVGDSESLRTALASAPNDAEIRVLPGRYLGRFEINQPLTLRGEPGAVLDAKGAGSALVVSASDVTLTRLTIRNWGRDLYEKDAAIRLLPGANEVTIVANELSGPGFGIYASEVSDLKLKDNQIEGEAEAFLLDRGDGIHLLKVNYPHVSGNRIKTVRDGIYLESGVGSRVYGNHLSELQYGLHYMYTKQDEAMDNLACRVSGGYALMNSEGIRLVFNRVREAKEFGVLLNLTHDAEIQANQIEATQMPNSVAGDLFSEGKGMFVYGAKRNQISGNYIAGNQIGIAMALGGEDNLVYQNQFLANATQVRYVGETRVEWSLQGRGNYWSDYRGWDLDGDGIGDGQHLPNDSLDRLFWLYPEAKFLMESPLVKLLKWLDNQLQGEHSVGVVDSHPVMAPPPHLGPAAWEAL